jgi:hypothetical protein
VGLVKAGFAVLVALLVVRPMAKGAKSGSVVMVH